ncbi:MAG TPA: hypothetical protein VG054_04750 [Acidimicrobiales bacterium]|jgi:hypothetical protein|nr:hypothetical protein [Acidimicrobiales bacterium]
MTTTEQPTDDPALEERQGAAVADTPRRGRSTGEADRPSHLVRSFLIAGAGYLVVSLIVWWHVWTGDPTTVTTCGCGDTSLFTWFLEWPAYALSHGLNPLYSTAMFHPTGVNLLSNTAEVGIGVVLVPVTWLFGPVATLNVALTLSPVLSALAMYVLLRRWVSWAPAAFVGGLLYGFSPFILIALSDAHLMLAMTPIPPLIVACLDELLVRQRRRPVPTGALLGLLVTVQFFIGSEMLVLTIIAAAIGVAFVVAFNIRRLDVIRGKTRHAAVALASAAATGGVLLAYPVGFALAGPARLAGPVWGPASLISYGGTNLKDYVLPAPPSALAAAFGHRFGGYQGPMLSGQYFGIALLAVLATGLVIWRHDLRLWLFAAVGAVSVPLSFGLQFHTWTLWRLLVRLPLMDNIIPSRFLLFSYLAAAVMLGLIVDHARTDIVRLARSRSADGAGTRSRRMGSVVGVAIAAVALVPIAWFDAGGLPFTTRAVVLPPWFRAVAPHLPEHQVVLTLPFPALQQSPMSWQAVDSMSYAMVGGGGPNSLSERAGRERAARDYLGALSLGSGESRRITTAEVASMRQALGGWGVTMVVVVDPMGLPTYDQVSLVRTAVTLMTAATGQLPIHQAHAWVWTGVRTAGPPVLASTGWLTACAAGPSNGPVSSLFASANCVLAAPRAHTQRSNATRQS